MRYLRSTWFISSQGFCKLDLYSMSRATPELLARYLAIS